MAQDFYWTSQIKVKRDVVLKPRAELPCGRHTYRLEELAFTRSGDKGDSANIGKKTGSQVVLTVQATVSHHKTI